MAVQQPRRANGLRLFNRLSRGRMESPDQAQRPAVRLTGRAFGGSLPELELVSARW
jgi:hypothetical protein